MSASKPRGKNWTHLEDEALCQAWLDVSQDPIVGTNQRSENLYGRIYDKFIEICVENSVTAHPELRAPSGIKSRWHFINKSVSKFAGCMVQINARRQSGASPEDNLKNAFTLYATREKSPFVMMHCYRILGNAPKWQQYHVVKAPAVKRSIEQVSNDGVQEIELVEAGTSMGVTNGIDRPRGRDSTKKQKSTGSETVELAKAGQLLAVAANAKANDSVQRTKVLKKIANHLIMSVDVSGLSDVAKQFYVLEQRRILDETLQEVTYASEESTVELADVTPVSEARIGEDMSEEFDESFRGDNYGEDLGEDNEMQDVEVLLE